MTDWETKGDWSKTCKTTSRYKYGKTRSEVITNSNTFAREGGVYEDGQKAHINTVSPHYLVVFSLQSRLFTASINSVLSVFLRPNFPLVLCKLWQTSSQGQTDQNVLLIRLSCAISLIHFRTADMKVQLSQSYSKLLYFRMTSAKEGGLMF